MQFQNHYSTLIHVTVTRVKETWDDFKAHWTEQDVQVIIFGDGLLGFCLQRCCTNRLHLYNHV